MLGRSKNDDDGDDGISVISSPHSHSNQSKLDSLYHLCGILCTRYCGKHYFIIVIITV